MTDYILTTPFQRARGVIARYPSPGDRYFLEYDSISERGVHMIGVHRPLKVSWLADGELVQEQVLQPWTGNGSGRADTIIEEPPAKISG